MALGSKDRLKRMAGCAKTIVNTVFFNIFHFLVFFVIVVHWGKIREVIWEDLDTLGSLFMIWDGVGKTFEFQ